MLTTVSHTVARSVIGTLGAVIVATSCIAAATAPAQASPATITVSAPVATPLT